MTNKRSKEKHVTESLEISWLVRNLLCTDKIYHSHVIHIEVQLLKNCNIWPQNAAFYQDPHCLLSTSGTEVHILNYLEISTCDPLKYIMVNPIVFICMGKSI